jgi:hypothetical protein
VEILWMEIFKGRLKVVESYEEKIKAEKELSYDNI